MRTLVAGFGNVLRGDDGFGVEVIRRLRENGERPDVELMEVGTAGIRLAQELLTPYDRLIIVDAMARGGAPGSVYVTEVEDVESAGAIDMHLGAPLIRGERDAAFRMRLRRRHELQRLADNMGNLLGESSDFDPFQ